jgi:hypothetical protein
MIHSKYVGSLLDGEAGSRLLARNDGENNRICVALVQQHVALERLLERLTVNRGCP